MSAYPYRLRRHGGRTTHAARPVANALGQTTLHTACGYTNGPRDELKPDDAAITCRSCTRATAEETAR